MARSRITRYVLLAMLLLPLILMMIRPAAGEEARPSDARSAAAAVGAAAAAHATGIAHEGYGVIVLEGRHPAEAGQVHYVVRVTWSEDGHPADNAGVTATVLDAFGNPVLPAVNLDPVDADGRYAGMVTFPGDGLWTVRFTSAVPAGSLDAVEQLPISVPFSLPDFSVIEFPPAPPAPLSPAS
jgi:hypothetical protein